MTSSNPKPISIWQYKPWWCQPWSIVLTGMGVIGGSWLLLKTVWVTGLVAVPIVVWMVFFLLVYPRAMTQVLLEAELAEQAGEGVHDSRD